MPLPNDRSRTPAGQAEETFTGGQKFQELRKRANKLRLDDPTLRERAGIPESTFRRYIGGRFGLAQTFDRHLLAIAAVVDEEERRLRALLKEPTRQ